MNVDEGMGGAHLEAGGRGMVRLVGGAYPWVGRGGRALGRPPARSA